MIYNKKTGEQLVCSKDQEETMLKNENFTSKKPEIEEVEEVETDEEKEADENDEVAEVAKTPGKKAAIPGTKSAKK